MKKKLTYILIFSFLLLNFPVMAEDFEKPPLPEDTNSKVVIEGGVTETVILSLDDCIQKALENNPAIQAAIRNSDIYNSRIGQAWSNYFPNVSWETGYSRNRFLVLNFPVPRRNYNSYSGMNTTITQLLYDFQKTATAAKYAKKNYEMSKNGLDEEINRIIFSVKDSYYSTLFALHQQEVNEDAVKMYEIHLEQAKAYYEIGTKAKIDVITAEYNLSNAKLNLIKAKNEVEFAFTKLNNAMGIPTFDTYKINDNLGNKEYELSFEKMLEEAYELSPEVLVAKNEVEAAEIAVKAAKVVIGPDLVLKGNFQMGGSRAFFQEDGYLIGGYIQWTNLNGMLIKKQLDEAKATLSKNRAEYEKVKQDIYMKLQQAYLEYIETKNAIPVSNLAVEQAEEQYFLASGRYKVGLSDAIEIKDAENTYRTARLNYYRTLLDYNVSVANMEQIVGAPLKSIEEEAAEKKKSDELEAIYLKGEIK